MLQNSIQFNSEFLRVPPLFFCFFPHFVFLHVSPALACLPSSIPGDVSRRDVVNGKSWIYD